MALPSRLAKPAEHPLGTVDGHFVEGRLPPIGFVAPSVEPSQHFYVSRRYETLRERIIEHIFHISRSRAVVEKPILVPYSALVHFAELFARHKGGIFVFKGLPIGS